MKIAAMIFNIGGGASNVVKNIEKAIKKYGNYEYVYPEYIDSKKEFDKKINFMFKTKIPKDVDIVHLNLFNLKAMFSKKPIISTFHGSTNLALKANYKRSFFTFLKELFMANVEKLVALKSNLNVCIDNSIRNQWFFFNKGYYIPNAADIDKYKPGLTPMFKSEKKIALFVGSNIKRKGIEDIEKIKKYLGPDYEIIRSFDKGFIPEDKLPNLYNSCDIFFTTTHYDGTVLVVLEAMACGKPIVCYDLYGLRDCVFNNVNGYLVKENDYKGFAEAIKKAYDNRERLGKNGRLLCEKIFNWDNVAEQYARLYDKLYSDIKK